MIGRRNFFGSVFRGAVAAVCGAIGIRAARPAEAAEFTARLVTPPPPMTVERAVEILNQAKYRGAEWHHGPGESIYGFPPAPACDPGFPRVSIHSLKPFIAIAIAEQIADVVRGDRHYFPGSAR